jgi:hypothetical protein
MSTFILNFQKKNFMAYLHYLATEIAIARSIADTARSPAARDTGHPAAARGGTAEALAAAGDTPLHSLSPVHDLPLSEKRSCAPRCQQGRRNNLERGGPGCISFSFGGIFGFFMYFIQHYFICRPSDSTVSADAGIEPMTVATSALAVRRSNNTWLDLIHNSARSHPQGCNTCIVAIQTLSYRTKVLGYA